MRRAPLFILVVFAGCSHLKLGGQSPPASSQPPPSSQAPAVLPKDLEALRERARALLEAQAELTWRSWAMGEAADASKLEVQGAELATPRSLALIDRTLAELSGSEKDSDLTRSLHALRLFLAGEQLARQTALASDTVARIASQAMLSVDGQELPFRDLEALLAGEAHLGRRRRIAQAALPVLRRLNGPLAQRESAAEEALKGLGYQNPLEFSAQLHEVDLEAAAALARAVLEKTEGPYRAALEEFARRELNVVSLGDLRRADVPRLLRTGEVDSFFPKEKLGAALTGLIAKLKLAERVKVDAEPRARKSPRALALEVKAPEVRLSLKPASGLSAWAQALHELGHAVSFAMNGSDRFELRQLSSGAAGEAAGFLFEGLLDDPRFCAGQGLPDVKMAQHRKAAALRKLFALRRAASRVLFELTWRKEPAANPGEKYRSIQASAFLFPVEAEEAERFLWDQEDSLAAVDELRGLIAAAALGAALESRAGPRWWESESAPAALAQVLRDEGRFSLEKLFEKASLSALDLAPLLSSVQEALAPSAPRAGR